MLRRRTVLAVVLATLLVATGCSSSKLAQDAAVTVSGTVLGADGKPLAGARVVLLKEADFGDVVFGLTVLAATLGTVCLTDQAPTICSKSRRATTADDGTYSFSLRGRDTQGSVGNAATFHLTTGTNDREPSVSARFDIQRADLTVPPLQTWAPKVDVTTNRTLRAQWTPREPGATERLVIYSGTGTDVAWVADGPSPVSIDPRIVEDTRGTAQVESESTAERDGTTFRLTHQSARVDYTGTAGTPVSRNAPCTPAPCALTDGDFGPPTKPPPSPVNAVTVDLGSSGIPTLLVVRGCPGECRVDMALDGANFVAAGTGNTAFFLVTPVIGAPVRYVRVRSTSDLSRLAEISVW